MGGFGSGRRRGKNTTDNYKKFDVRKLQRDNLLTPGRAFNLQWTGGDSIHVSVEPDQLILKYSHKRTDGAWQPMKYPIHIVWTPCNYGGKRPWFICPMGGCGRRVAILWGGDIFACRHCHQLAYACQGEVSHDRALRRAQNIRRRLGGSANMLEPFPPKPKGMRWYTYWRMEDQHYAFYNVALVGMAKQIGMKIDI